MNTKNQATRPSEEEFTNNISGEAAEASNLSGRIQASTTDLTIPSETEDGESYLARAKDIRFDPSLHERRAFSEDDLAFASAVISQPHLIAPFPVVRRGKCRFLVDGFVHLSAVLAHDENALVKCIEVSEDDALAIRFADARRGRSREPMAPSRQALARHRSGVSQEAIAREIGVSAGNISQMISAAEVEEELDALANLLSNRSKVSRGWWFDIYTTRERLKKADNFELDGRTPNMDRFRRAIDELLEAGGPFSKELVGEKLKINVKRAKPKRRNRMLGKPEKRQGVKIEIYVDRDRQGGRVINFPPGLPDWIFEAALEILLTFLTGLDPNSAPQS